MLFISLIIKMSTSKIISKIIDRNNTRGVSKTSWLESHHTFSFNMYWNKDRTNFGALCVLNDDTVAPHTGFGRHPHENMEIVSIPLEGRLTHQDSTGSKKSIEFGEIQTMTAGTGIFHSEMNDEDKVCKFLQIWIEPNQQDLKPKYNDYRIKDLLQKNKLNLIVSPDGDVPASLNQDAYFSLGDFDEGIEFEYSIHSDDHGIYIFVLDGEVTVLGETLETRDGFGVSGPSSFNLKTTKQSRILLIEIPMIEPKE